MAIWQFDVSLVPAAASWSDREHAPLNSGEITFLHRLLAATTPRVSNVDDGSTTYGYAHGNRIDLTELAPGKHAAWIAIDARSDCDYFCRLVCQLARVLDCELFSPEFETTLSPTRKGLLSGLMRSRAWTYALDPTQFQATSRGRRGC